MVESLGITHAMSTLFSLSNTEDRVLRNQSFKEQNIECNLYHFPLVILLTTMS